MRFLVALVLCWAGAALHAAEPDYAPAWVLQTPAGETVQFPEDAGGHPSVLLFWPSWCPYSRALQPYVQDIWRDYSAVGVKVWTINIRERGDPVAAMRQRDLHFPLLLKGDGLIPRYHIVRTPWLVVVAGDGRIVYTRPANPGGPVAVAKAVRAALNALLGTRAVPLPQHYPPPYDLHLKDRSTVDLVGSAPLPLPESEWLPWVERYLLELPEASADAALLGRVADGKTAIGLARAAWSETYGAEAVRSLAPFRAFMRDGVWVIVTTGGPGMGRGLVYALDQSSGRVRAIEDRR